MKAKSLSTLAATAALITSAAASVTKNQKKRRKSENMKIKPTIMQIAAAVLLSALAAAPANAEISITNFSLTSNSVSFSISGNLPSTAPDQSLKTLFFLNSNLSASPGFALGSFNGSSSKSFSGSQPLSSVMTGNSSNGDYFFTSFTNNLTANEAISGTLTANWTGGPAFDPSQVTNLNVYWGTVATNGGTIFSGPLLTTVNVAAVPEPSSLVLMMLASGVMLIRRKR